MGVSVSLIRKLEQVEPFLREVLIAVLEEIERQREETVTKKEFNELKEIVRELAEAQKRTEERVEELAQAQSRTEQRLDSLAQKVEELAEAQKRTEERLEELAQAQKKTEQRLDSLAQKVEELAEAQKRTEQRVEELAQAQSRTEQRLDSLAQKVEELAAAQKRTEQRVEELAAAQKRTEEELRKLVVEHSKTREQLGGLSMTVGYILENEAMKALPRLLEEEFGLRVEGRLVRKFLVDVQGNPMEVNIVGEAARDGERYLLVGESKSQLSKGGVNEFLRKKLGRLPKAAGLEFFPVLVTHMVTAPDVVEYALSRGIKRVYYSYEFV
jgi:hypothetical protein